MNDKANRDRLELCKLKAHGIIQSMRMNIASAEMETQHRDGWSCDHNGLHQELQSELDRTLDDAREFQAGYDS